MSKYKYRSFLRDRVSFVNTTCIKNPEILNTIHLNFRLIYLRDTATARWIDEGTYELLMNVSCLIFIDDKCEFRGYFALCLRE